MMYLLLVFPFLLVATVIVHYLFLSRMTVIFYKKWPQSVRLVSVICGLFLAHIVEIMIYAEVYSASQYFPGFISSPQKLDFGDWVNALYFSFVAYSSLGAGDLIASGTLKILYGLEAINGLLLITWSASYSLLTMSQLNFCGFCSASKIFSDTNKELE